MVANIDWETIFWVGVEFLFRSLTCVQVLIVRLSFFYRREARVSKKNLYNMDQFEDFRSKCWFIFISFHLKSDQICAGRMSRFLPFSLTIKVSNTSTCSSIPQNLSLKVIHFIMWSITRFGTICKIIKNVKNTLKNTDGGVSLLVKLQVQLF